MGKGIREKISIYAAQRLNWNISLLLWVVFWFFSLPPYGIGMSGVVSFVFPLCALKKAKLRDIAIWTWLWTALCELSTIWWIIPTIHRFGGIPLFISMLIMLCLCLYLGLFAYLFFIIMKLLADRFGNAGMGLAPSLWVVLEWLKGNLFGGFSWWGVGYSLSMYDCFLQNTHIFGILGLSFLAIMVSSGIAMLIVDRKSFASLGFSSITLLLALTAAIHGFYYQKQDLSSYNGFRIGYLQPQISQDKKWDRSFKEETNRRLRTLSLAMKNDALQILIWPESSIPVAWGEDPELDGMIRGVAKEMKVPLLFGAVFSDEHGMHNGAILVDSEGDQIGSYEKTHLVPFGEYVPFEKTLSFLSPIVESVGSFQAGKKLDPLPLGDVKLGVNICFEAIFPDIIRKQANCSAGIIINLSNDAWYEGTPALAQHFLMDRVRAVENFRYFVRSANGGVSAVVDPFGKSEHMTRLGEPASFWGDARIIQKRTLYGKIGDKWIFPLLLLVSIGLFLSFKTRRPENL
jgi:apolipoprotein N-acyltransferase